MFQNPSSERIRDLLGSVKTIAVVGFSPKPHRASHGVARAMKTIGYRVIPVRPGIGEGLGEKAYARLADLPETPDLVDVFRASGHVAGIVEDCIALKVGKLWLQEGVVDETAAQRAVDAGITVVMDRCILKDYVALMR